MRPSSPTHPALHGPHARAPLPLLIWTLAALAACGPSNTAATYQKTHPSGAPIINIGTCCIGYDSDSQLERIYAGDKAPRTAWIPVVEPDGQPKPAGHPDDAYYTGPKPRAPGTLPPPAYHYRAPAKRAGGALRVCLAERWPQLKRVRFGLFNSLKNGRLTPQGAREVETWISQRYDDAHPQKLGEGGFAVAYKTCPSPKNCKAVKIRKIPKSFAEWKQIEDAKKATEDLKRDLATFEVAEIVTQRALYLDAQGQPAPFLIQGAPAQRLPGSRSDGPPGRLATVAQPTSAELLVLGVVEQELITFDPTPEVRALMTSARPTSSDARKKAMAELRPESGISPHRVAYFFERYTDLSKIGPEVYKVQRFVNDCERLRGLPSVARYCLTLRRSFQIPDDFLDRLAALEQMYRDSAAEVMRFSRRNFRRALGNPARDGEVREIGLDYNHGRNVGWDPRRRQFVLFDC